ncbi:MAG: B12-binding domain-containing radical SAM protein [Flavobacteriales bacterium]|nr:B12-binding domain-containing radical SAM protein [Flavobacteriales bacterium]
MQTGKVILFNPRSAGAKHRIPNSILQVAASIHGQVPYVFVDGNLEPDPEEVIDAYLATGEYAVLALTCMPGPQLRQAIPITKHMKARYPELVVIWGGYFATNQYKTVMDSGWVDYIIHGPGDHAFPTLLEAVKAGSDVSSIQNLIYKKEGQVIRNPAAQLPDMDALPALPYDYLSSFYDMHRYLGRTFLGKRTIAYHSSFGCPFTCSFCAVVPIYKARWKGMSAERIHRDVMHLKKTYGADAIEFHDNNFFVSEARTVRFAELIASEGMQWWGEGRIDTLHKYSDESLQKIRDAGCKMIFFGAETGNDEVLKRMDKGGTQTGQQIKDFAARLKRIGIVPEYSFVLGLPAETEVEVLKQIDEDIAFIREIKEINPEAEIIIYTYSPVPTEGSDLFKEVSEAGFQFPQHLEDWLSPSWENFDLRRNPLTPWLTRAAVDRIRNFETVLNGYHPTASDFRIRGWKKTVMRMASGWRYHSGIYEQPLEVKLLQKIWKYRRPEKEGFYAE